MAGVPNAILSGWKIPVTYWPVADHTYVTSDCGLVWGCNGNGAHGTTVASAPGDSSIADCIAEPGGMAGIRWNRNGWCHQIANRILHPAGITVAGVRGYQFSCFKFGTYGRNLPPPNLSPCYGGGSVPSGAAKLLGSADVRLLLRAPTRMGNAIAEAAHMSEFHGPSRVDELAMLVRSTPGLILSEHHFSALAEIQGRLWKAEDDLGALLDNEEITPETFAERSIECTTVCMEQCEKLIGRDNFDLLFGEAGRSPAGIMDRDTFVADYERSHPTSSGPSF